MFADYRNESIPDPLMFRSLLDEERNVAVDGPGGGHWIFEPRAAVAIEQLHNFVRGARKSLEPAFKARDYKPEEYQQALQHWASEFLRLPGGLLNCLEGLNCSVDINRLVAAVKSLPPAGQHALTFFNTLAMAAPCDQQAWVMAALQNLMEDEGGFKKELRARQQRSDRRFDTIRALIAGRTQRRRTFGCLQLEFGLQTDPSSRHDPFPIVHFKNKHLKDWKRKQVFRGVLDFASFILPNFHKGAVYHLLVIFDPDVITNIEFLADGLGGSWQEVAEGRGNYHATHRLSVANPMRARGVGFLDAGNPMHMQPLWEGMRYLCERELFLRVPVERLETFSHGSVKDGHWERAAETAGNNVPVSSWGAPGAFTPGFPGLPGLAAFSATELKDPDAVLYYLGYDVNAGRAVYHRPGELAAGHLLVTGPTGCGKTRWGVGYARHAIEQAVACVVIDPHNQALGQLDLPAVVLSNGASGVKGINPLKLWFLDAEAKGIDGQIDDKVEYFNQCTLNSMGHRERDVMKEALRLAYARHGLVGSKPSPEWQCPNCRDLEAVLEEFLADDERKGQRKSIQGCLSAVRASFGNAVFNQPESFEIEHYQTRGARLDISHLSRTEQGVVTEAVLQQIWNHMKELGPLPVPPANDRERFRLVIMIDEAHILNQAGQRDAPGRMLSVIAREGRKFGICLVLLSQSLDDFSAAVKKNIPAWLVFRLSDDAEARVVARKFRVKEEALLNLKNAEQALFWDGRVPGARRVELAVGLNDPGHSQI